MGARSCLNQAIFLAWLLYLWPFITVLESQVEASNIINFGRRLIEQSDLVNLCSKTGPDFPDCMECLNGPDLARDDETETLSLGAKTIRCAHNSAVLAGNAMNDYSKNSTGAVQAAAVFCLPDLVKTSESFNEAIGLWSEKKKDETLNKIMSGRDSYYECASKIPSESPPSLFHVLGSVRTRGEVAEFIIRSINV